MSRRTKVIIACTITWLIISCIVDFITGQDNWIRESIVESIIYGLGIWIGYTQGMKD